MVNDLTSELDASSGKFVLLCPGAQLLNNLSLGTQGTNLVMNCSFHLMPWPSINPDLLLFKNYLYIEIWHPTRIVLKNNEKMLMMN